MLTREIMTPEVHSVEAEMSLREAVEALRGWNVAGAPVLKGTEVVGVVSVADILELQATSEAIPAFRENMSEWGDVGEPEPWQEGDSPPLFFVEMWPNAGADVSERMAAVEGPEWDFLAEHVVAEVMTRKVVTVAPDADVREAARLMHGARVHRALVMDGDRLAGLVSASDIVAAVAEGRI